uniref:Putative polyprotein (Retrotransposon protein) n=1 Tax=Malus domestica TaxID=3750 RepID=E4Z8L6_MALDO|nr:putative polyprotein (retrotransposon protein) [Malus domestica]
MSNLNKLNFTIFGKNYHKWVHDVKLHLTAKNLRLAIEEETDNPVGKAEKAIAMIFIRRHIHDVLQIEYLAEKDSRALWVALADRFDHQNDLFLPEARHTGNICASKTLTQINVQNAKRGMDHWSCVCRAPKKVGDEYNSRCKKFESNFVQVDEPKTTMMEVYDFQEDTTHMEDYNIQGDIYGLIHSPCGPFRYFMVLVDASTRWSHVCLLSTRNATFSKLLAQVIKLEAYHPDYLIKYIRLDNAGEFTSKTFDDYCMSVGYDLADAFIKRLQMIARSLVIHPCTTQSETEVQRILDLHCIAQSIPNVFTNLARVTRSHIPAANTPAKTDIPNVRWTSFLEAWDTNLSDPPWQTPWLNDSHPRKRKSTAQGPEEPTVNLTIAYSFYPIHDEILNYGSVLEETNPHSENRGISVYYASLDDVWRRNDMIIDDALAFAIMLSDNIELHFIDECRHKTDWLNWKQEIQVELDSLAKHKVFVRKRNEKNKIVHYKARLVAQGFSQRLMIDYDETYSPIMDVITFCYLISLKSHSRFAIVAIYVDDMNVIKTPEEVAKTATHLKSEFEMKDLDAKRDLFRPNEDDEEILEPKVPYISAIGALLYLA